MQTETTTAQTSFINKKSIAIIILVIILASLLGGYFFWWKKTPRYSLGLLQNAIKTHDLVLFKKHFDVDTFSNKFVDYIFSQASDSEDVKNNPIAQSFINGFINNMKPKLVSVLNTEIQNLVETGSIGKKEDQSVDNNAISPEKLTENTRFTKSEIKGIEYTKTDGKTAFVGVKLYDSQLQQSFIIEVKMHELEDGTWQVSEISNFKEYMDNVTKAKETKLAELNKPISDQINSAISIGQLELKRQQKNSFAHVFIVSTPLEFLSEQSIIEVAGVIRITDSQGKVILESTTLSKGSSYKGKKGVINYSLDINPFIPSQKAVIDIPVNELSAKFTITSIKFADGSERKLLKDLPNS